ncbi:hypothetical protein K491DRAFT_10232 [Lophiostoma macrostomum CBS 122681]|uniref:Uncharacterized protein n=1 Tax=Lophiostoma macrostomum CBS 122681 TaxID=1314788 RepID=A0A6A6TSC6_9PLEO|nr:hypothetical protein K491DRAFT_10232 [Lophiostoma macrostomum CBS 122681]
MGAFACSSSLMPHLTSDRLCPSAQLVGSAGPPVCSCRLVTLPILPSDGQGQAEKLRWCCRAGSPIQQRRRASGYTWCCCFAVIARLQFDQGRCFPPNTPQQGLSLTRRSGDVFCYCAPVQFRMIFEGEQSARWNAFSQHHDNPKVASRGVCTHVSAMREIVLPTRLLRRLICYSDSQVLLRGGDIL